MHGDRRHAEIHAEDPRSIAERNKQHAMEVSALESEIRTLREENYRLKGIRLMSIEQMMYRWGGFQQDELALLNDAIIALCDQSNVAPQLLKTLGEECSAMRRHVSDPSAEPRSPDPTMICVPKW